MRLMASVANDQCSSSCCVKTGYLGTPEIHKRHKILQTWGKLFILCSTSLFEIVRFSTKPHKLYEY